MASVSRRALVQAARSSGRAMAAFWHSRALRPVGVARAAGTAAEWMWYTAVTVFAYQLGGVPAVGVIAVASVLPAAVLSPVLGYLVDRYPRHRVLTGAVAVRAVALGLAAVSYYAGTSVAVLAGFTALEGVATLLVRPATTALLPLITRRPAELVSAQATLGAVDSAGLLLGSIAGGLVLSVATAGVAFSAAAAVALAAVVAGAFVRTEMADVPPEPAGGLGRALRQSLRGFPAIAADRVWVVALATWAALLLSGATEVFVVAIAFELLDLPEFGPGVLTACIGLGGILGGAAMSGIVGRRLGPWLVLAVVLMGASLTTVALVASTGVVIVLLAALGGGLAIAVVAGQTQLQRLVRDAEVGRALGVTEAVGFFALALGAAAAPRLIVWIGLRPTLSAVGLAGVALALVLARPLRHLDERVGTHLDEVEALDGIAFLDPLPNAARARIASRVASIDVADGEVVTFQGEDADSFYIVDEGRLEVLIDARRVNTLGAGEFFGELALLADEPRMATVRAVEPTILRALRRQDFLTVVTGHAAIGSVVSEAAADRRHHRPTVPSSVTGTERDQRALLRSMPLFAYLPAERLERLAATCRLRTVPPGATVFTAGAPADDLYLVVQGRVDARAGDEAVRLVGAGATIGAPEALRRRPHAGDAVAPDGAEVLCVPRGPALAALTDP